MKKLILSLFAMVSAIVMFAQTTPKVTLSITDSTKTSVTVNFDKNEFCSNYFFLLSEESAMPDIHYWINSQMFPGTTLDSLVVMWGKKAVNDTTYTWTDLNPAEKQTIYVVPFDNQNKAYTVDSIVTHTAPQGGTGTASVTLSVDNITITSARTTATPNDQTAYYYDAIIPVELFNTIGEDSTKKIIMESPQNKLFVEDTWEWGLEPNSNYYFCAFAFNINNEMGAFEKTQFSTLSLGGNGEAEVLTTISNITQTTVKVEMVPGDQTAGFTYICYTDADFNNIGLDSITNLLKEKELSYETISGNFENLTAATTYQLFTIAQNANKVWGAVEKTEFTTLESSIEEDHIVRRIYPNPSNGIINIDMSDKANANKAIIYSITGQKVYEQSINSSSTIVNARSLSNGVYTINVVSDNNEIIGTQRISIVK